jgi:predicted NAD/FAD-binding protein
MTSIAPLRIAIVGAGISGLSAAWLLSQRHEVAVYEKAHRVGGHSNTVLVSLDGGQIPVDTGFIVFNPETYPNFVALLRVLGALSEPSDMSFGVSIDRGKVEYSGSNLSALFGQRSNLVRPGFWSMLADLMRFYRQATRDAKRLCDESLSLGDYLARGGYGARFRDHHIQPMAAAIWSATPKEILGYPVTSFLRFHDNHGLLQLSGRPIWRTVTGGSREYVALLTRPFADRIRRGVAIACIERAGGKAIVVETNGMRDVFDHVVIATHADEALALLAEPSEEERALLGAFRYTRNEAILHTDDSLMPRRRSVWSSWNYIGGEAAPDKVCVTYWMNRLQNLPTKTNFFVTLNPPRAPRAGSIVTTETYDHPIFDAAAIAAQRRLWRLQGGLNTWFCGAHFGAGFHEDGLQAGLAVAEQLGGVKRPWTVANESGRIQVTATARPSLAAAA